MTGGRLKRVADYVKDEEMFCLTYGDGVSDVNITGVDRTHKSRKTLAAITRNLQPQGGGSVLLELDWSSRQTFQEKPPGDGTWINGGFFVMSPKAIDYVDGDSSVLERDVMERLTAKGELSAYLHHGFWQP